MSVPAYSKAGLASALRELRGLLAEAGGVEKAPRILERAGIRCVIVEALTGTKVDGACLWLDGKSPVIGLSFRYDRIDWFWFTLLHELGHVKHEDGRKDGPVLDVDLVGTGARTSADKSKVEQRADRFATEFLLDQRDLNLFVAESGDSYSTAEIVGYAERHKVHAGIVVGQLQHRKLVPYSHFRGHLEKVRERVTSASKTDGWGVLHTGKSGSRG
jgi:HTH-type transcriptional regulator/antitoxin HigA